MSCEDENLTCEKKTDAETAGCKEEKAGKRMWESEKQDIGARKESQVPKRNEGLLVEYGG